jgi:hypothetical protein
MSLPLSIRHLVPLVAALAVLAAAAVTLLPAEAAPARDAADRQALAQLAGTYRSTSAEDWGRGSFGTREFGFDNGRWTLKFTLALDPQMKNRVFEFRTHGQYFVGAASKTVPGAFDALFTEDAKYVTLRTPDLQLVTAFGLAGCGLAADVEKDISREGCALWKPVAACGVDHDLLALDEQGGLRFGVRPPDNDMCTAARRPATLLPAVVKR